MDEVGEMSLRMQALSCVFSRVVKYRESAQIANCRLSTCA